MRHNNIAIDSRSAKYTKGSYSVLILVLLFSCAEFVEIDPPKNEIVSEVVFDNDEAATSALRGIYSEMVNSIGFASGGVQSITFLAGLSSDEFDSFSASDNEFVTNNLTPTNATVRQSLWRQGYQCVYSANVILENVKDNGSLSASTKMQLEGEALFIRAFCHFNLAVLFGDVPWVGTSDWRTNERLSRTSEQQVYAHIVDDLKKAKQILPEDFSVSRGERVRPNKGAAIALLARLHLYSGNWSETEEEASSLIEDGSLYSLETDLDKTFLANSKEAIWQLMPNGMNSNTQEGNLFILTSTPNKVALSPRLLEVFESQDLRKLHWVGTYTDQSARMYYYPFKYKIKTGTPLVEYSMVLRLAEQYLIRSEARLHQNKLDGAIDDLNVVRRRAGLNDLDVGSLSLEEIQLAIEKERRLELFAEWGHRWFDLRRTSRANEVLSALSTKNWQPTDVLYPIPQNEINSNANITQNPGY